MCLKLTEKYFNTKRRTLCIDNFFTSISLAKTLLEKGISVCGTLKKNKPELPFQLLPNKKKEVGSSIFAFKDDLTIVSYVPKCNKAVILISTLHHNNVTNPFFSNKPEIILFYNKNKGPIDQFDQKCEKNTCRRKTNRWTVNVFYFILDAAALNAFILFELKNRNALNMNDNRLRLRKLKDLAISLITSNINQRIRNASVNNFSGWDIYLINTFEKLGFEIKKQHRRRINSEDSENSEKADIRYVCDNRECRGEGKKTKYRNSCNECGAYFCPLHGEIIKTSLCKNCIRL